MYSKIRIADVSDGTSNTFLIGEKANFSNQSWCSQGQGCNEFLWVHHQSQGMITTAEPLNYVVDNSRAAASAHTGGAQFVYVDGSVHFVPNACAGDGDETKTVLRRRSRAQRHHVVVSHDMPVRIEDDAAANAACRRRTAEDIDRCTFGLNAHD